MYVFAMSTKADSCLLFLKKSFVKAGIMFYAYPKEKPESQTLEKIQLKHLILAFLILGVGCFVASLVFLLEMIYGEKGDEAKKALTSEKKDQELHQLTRMDKKTHEHNAD